MTGYVGTLRFENGTTIDWHRHAESLIDAVHTVLSQHQNVAMISAWSHSGCFGFMVVSFASASAKRETEE